LHTDFYKIENSKTIRKNLEKVWAPTPAPPAMTFCLFFDVSGKNHGEGDSKIRREGVMIRWVGIFAK
jgi:hypothetical protein